jgi:hypothetical protein
MKKYLLISFFTLSFIGAFATDTLRYPTGEIQMVWQPWKFYKNYYRNGQLQRYTKQETIFRKGRLVEYDSLGNVTSKGKTKFNGHKCGRWIEYDENRKKRIVHYKYGIEKSKRRAKDGKKVRYILVHGLGAWNVGLCDSAITKYHVNFIAIGGCMMPRASYPKASLHNFFVECCMIMRYRWNWEDKADTLCGDHKRF